MVTTTQTVAREGSQGLGASVRVMPRITAPLLGCALVLIPCGITVASQLASDASPAAQTQPPPTTAATAATPPALDGWRLTLPVDDSGGTDGGAAVLNPATLDPPYLNRAADGSLDFWAPTTGATTSHSGSPRTELIDNTGFTAGNSGVHTLAATVTVSQVPSTSKTIVVGQIHGSGSLTSDPYTLLYYADGRLHVKVNQQLESGGNYLDYPLLTDVGLGTQFSYTITDRGDGTLHFTATANGTTQEQTAPIPDVWSGSDVRFQAGDYEQLKGDPSDGDGGRVNFAALTAS